MNRRKFTSNIAMIGVTTALVPLHGLASNHASARVMTVGGWIKADQLGMALSHEHILVDFIGADRTGYHRWEKTEVVQTMQPYLQQVRALGVRSFFECTPAFIGRDPVLLKRLADNLDMHIVTNTGLYGARDNLFLPNYAFEESADRLAERWVAEWEGGIENTGIRPGFIKIGIDRGPLSAMHRKLVQAAARAHLGTGLTIAAHTGTAVGAFEEFAVLQEEGVHPSAMIWVHAQAEKDYSRHVEAARLGAWVSLDGVKESNAPQYLVMLQNMKDHGLLGKVLISHDAGWYSPGEPSGGDIRGYNAVFESLLPILRQSGFSDVEVDQLMVRNPASAYAVAVRKI